MSIDRENVVEDKARVETVVSGSGAGYGMGYEAGKCDDGPNCKPDPFNIKDPWAHRSLGMRCATCMWFVAKGLPYLGKAQMGRCRRHAPTMNGYPVVFANDWCGDHKLDEEKI